MKNIFILLFLLPLISSCGHDKYQKPEPNKPNSITIKTIEINKINFYFENSGSINGYLEGKDFRQSIRTILLKIEGKNHNSYFVNSKAYPEPNMLNRITKNDIRTNGMENSDHKFIFTNAINNSKGNDLSIVITDGIYSVKNGNINDVEVDIKAAFEKALTTNTIETVVLKICFIFLFSKC